MTGERPTGTGRRGRLWPHPVLAAALAMLVLLLLCWPFVQVPRPTLPTAFLHVFASWSAAIAMLWWISRGFGRGPDADGGDRDG
jgi:hypothetical protein